jgi:hypothetical protein
MPRSHTPSRAKKMSEMPACRAPPICSAARCHANACLVVSRFHSLPPTGCLPPCRYIARCFRGARRRYRAPFPSMGLGASTRQVSRGIPPQRARCEPLACARQALPKAVCSSPLPACGPLALSMPLRPAPSQSFPAPFLTFCLSAPPDRASRRSESRSTFGWCHVTSGVGESSALALRIALASPPPLAGTQTSGARQRQVRASISPSSATPPRLASPCAALPPEPLSTAAHIACPPPLAGSCWPPSPECPHRFRRRRSRRRCRTRRRARRGRRHARRRFRFCLRRCRQTATAPPLPPTDPATEAAATLPAGIAAAIRGSGLASRRALGHAFAIDSIFGVVAFRLRPGTRNTV